MKFMSFFRILLLLILLTALFFRVYRLESFYVWGHDQDLFAWIAKDIMVDHHFRLIGQETSITGVFIGPIFYYLMALSMSFFKMNPLGAYVPVTAISLFTVFSIYWVFTKFFGKKIGLTGAFLYAISPGVILLDRWIVPTQPTTLWCIWYFYVLLSILKGRLPLVLIGLLIGLIWHVHVAFIPLLLLLPAAWFLSGKRTNLTRISVPKLITSLLVLIVLALPFFVFEVRHNFGQIKGLTAATYEEKGDVKGIKRISKVFNMSGRSLSGIFLLDKSSLLPIGFFMAVPAIFSLGTLYLFKKKLLSNSQTLIFLLWICIDLLAQFVSKRSIPEYYFNNLFVVFFLVLSLLISAFDNLKKSLRFAPILMLSYLLIVTYWFVSRPDDSGSYFQKRKTVEYIKEQSFMNGYPCAAINYIEGQPGLPNGFRYLFWLNNLKVVTAGNDIPVYSIVTPWTISKDEIKFKSGLFGVINPPQKIINSEICSDPNRQLLPLWGFVN